MNMVKKIDPTSPYEDPILKDIGEGGPMRISGTGRSSVSESGRSKTIEVKEGNVKVKGFENVDAPTRVKKGTRINEDEIYDHIPERVAQNVSPTKGAEYFSPHGWHRNPDVIQPTKATRTDRELGAEPRIFIWYEKGKTIVEASGADPWGYHGKLNPKVAAKRYLEEVKGTAPGFLPPVPEPITPKSPTRHARGGSVTKSPLSGQLAYGGAVTNNRLDRIPRKAKGGKTHG
jgi:hypothetical protein